MSIEVVKPATNEIDGGDLLKVIPIETVITIRGEGITINPIRVGKLPKTLALLSPILAFLPKPGDNPETFKLNVPALFIDNIADVIVLTSFMIDKPIEWVEDLDAEELIIIVLAIIKVNSGFFTQRIIPLLTGVIPKITDLLKR
jgi:hypothetical protein